MVELLKMRLIECGVAGGVTGMAYHGPRRAVVNI